MKNKNIKSNKGSAILVALTLTAAIGVWVASTLQNSVHEGKMNERHFTVLQANNAAESVVEYGTSQLIKRWRTQTNFRSNELSPSSKPLTIENELTNFFKEQSLAVSNVALMGGVIPPNAQFYVDPDDPANIKDRHKGKNVLARNIEIYGRATVTHTSKNIGDHTSYAMQVFQLRDAPLISHAIFYNMDLEFHPGPEMDIGGPVHANGNIWVVAKNRLSFHGIVTSAQNLRVGMMRKQFQDDWSGMSGESDQTGKKVKFQDLGGKWKDLYRGSGPENKGSSYYQSNTSDSIFTADKKWGNWKAFTDNYLGGAIMTSAHGVPNLNPVGYDKYVPDEGTGQKLENHAYALIEPNLKFTDPKYKGHGEEEKFARKAGLIAKVYRSTDGTNTATGQKLPDNAVRLRSRPDRDDGWSSATANYLNSVTAANPTTFNTDFYVAFYSLKRSDPAEPNSDIVVNEKIVTETDPVSGESIQVRYTEAIEEPIYMAPGFDAAGNAPGLPGLGLLASDAQKKRKLFDDIFAAHPFIESSGNITSGMQDQKVKSHGSTADSKMNIVEINTAALANAIEIYNTDFFQNYEADKKYNGAVYVELERNPNYTARADNLAPAVKNIGVMLTEGGGSNQLLGRVPDPSFNKNKVNRDEGFTLVTNAPLYVRGHFNADGNLNTPSTTDFNNSDDPAKPRPPVALAADAITILSDAWKMADSKNKNTAAVHTEFAAAIISGLSPTNKGGANVSSGGSHNFPRFLENWSGDTFRYRGSLIALYESEVQAEPWSTGYYSPPKREWGYYTPFAEGNFPPIMPNVRDYKKLDFRFLTKSQYEQKLAALPWNSSSQSQASTY